MSWAVLAAAFFLIPCGPAAAQWTAAGDSPSSARAAADDYRAENRYQVEQQDEANRYSELVRRSARSYIAQREQETGQLQERALPLDVEPQVEVIGQSLEKASGGRKSPDFEQPKQHSGDSRPPLASPYAGDSRPPLASSRAAYPRQEPQGRQIPQPQRIAARDPSSRDPRVAQNVSDLLSNLGLPVKSNNDDGDHAVAASPASSQIVKKINGEVQRMEMTVNTSRILTIDGKFTRAQVNDPGVLTVTPLSPNEIQISAKKPGVTQVHLWDNDKRIYSVDISIYGDVQELQMALRDQYPSSAIKVYRYTNSLVLKGFVDRPDHVSGIVRLADNYAPGQVINNMEVGGVQQIKLHVQVMEVSRTKLREVGFDFANVNGNDFVISSISGLISAASAGGVTGVNDTVRFGIIDNSNSFFGLLRALRQNNLMKVLAEPQLVTVSGRAASFNVGGEQPVPVPQGLGTVGVEFKKFGTQVEFMPLVLGNGNIRLEVRPRVSELDSTLTQDIGGFDVPGQRVREIDTGVEMKAGQTLALAGLISNRVEAQNKGIPILADLPWVGAAFRSVQHTNNEIELLILVRPELVQAMDAYEVPPGRPGLNTVNPCDWDLYLNGHLEVPRGHGYPNAANRMHPGVVEPVGPPAEYVPAGPPAEEVAPPPPVPPQARRSPRQAVRQDRRSGSVYPTNAHIPHDPANPQQPAAAAPSGRLIGPVGYDVR